MNIHSDVSSAIPRVGIPSEKPHEITYYCLCFKKLALDFFFFGNIFGDHWVSHCQIIAFFEDFPVFRNAVSHPDFSFLVCTVSYSLSLLSAA